ncbi:MAG TPA: class I SAM-dependent methyltransferase [Gaiellaceae bacterium]|jgi:demethylmenaquinone methyltransferase/2-methoxy-6-polyprenyl-1,4-benzoquinol methylase|nr:class I SAM-dependent methyltransferase [Gaiellaceae bacterium]
MSAEARPEIARRLFAPLGPSYDRAGAALSLGQDPRWRRFLVSHVPPLSTVLDVATGTGAVARRLLDRGCAVTGLDQSPGMLAVARRRLGARAVFVEGRAESLPFADESFDALTFTYLLRYVEEPGDVLRELTRVVRPGGTVAMLEFFVPRAPWRGAWDLYVDRVLPLAGRLFGPEWEEVGRFLGPSIRDFWERTPLERLLELWREAGIREPRHRVLSLGGGIVVWGRRR